MSLLGDLFDETNDATEDCESRGGKGGQKTAESEGTGAPIPPRPSHGFCGVINQGATCYLNALIQTLVMTPEFREALFHVGQTELGHIKDKDTPGSKVRIIPIHLQRLIARLLLLNAQAVRSADLTDSFGWTNSEEREQHDVQELNRILFSAIEDSLVGTSGEKMIRNLYHGTIVNQIKCEECGACSDREEDFLDLCVTVSGCSGLEDSLMNSFVREEILNNLNKYHCSKCSKLTNAVKRAWLRHLPPVLTVSLLRFNFDFVKMERYKEVGKFSFPMKLNMSKFCKNTGGSDFSADYELFSIVIHRGSTHGGHYHAYIRDIDNIGKWTHPNENEICLVPTDAGSSPLDVIECNSCQSVLKSILQRSGKKSGMSVDALCGELMKQTGVSWNKRFKKQYGPITKFLKKYDDQFVYNQDTNWVFLKEEQVVGEGDICPQSQPKGSDRTPFLSPDPDQHWFDFDDIHIRPILLKDIENQFSGKESAYMLFYRNQSLIRPPEAFCNPAFGITEQLICDIITENIELEQQRSLYQMRMNIVSVQVHFGSSYFYANGALHASDGVCPFLELSIDRRNSVSELLFAIADKVPFNEENHVIHIAKETPAGLHLYQAITDDLTSSLMSCGIGNFTKVFLWDGLLVGGEPVITGLESEPVLLNVICSTALEFSSGFAKNLTVRELKEAVSLRSSIPYRHLHLALFDEDSSGGGGGAAMDNLFSDEMKTLKQLKLDNFSRLYAMDSLASSKQPYVSNTHAKQQMTFMVENHCLEPEEGSSWQTICVKVDKESTVEELKTVILTQQYHQSIDSVLTRLRIDDNGLGVKPPLYEHETITAAGLTEGLQLLLEAGPPPQPNQVMLFVSVVKSSKVTACLELIVEKSMKISQLLELAIDSAAMESSDWHLCRLDWNGEPLEILDDVDLSVEGCHLNHGDQLSLEVGHLPPKGFLQISVYLCPKATQSFEQQPGFLQQLSMKVKEWLTFQNSTREGDSECSSQMIFKSLGTIVISKLAKISELKEQILALNEMKLFSIPTAKFLRLRLLQSKQLGKVLRPSFDTLQQLKLVNGCGIGVQLLTDEEDLSKNQLLLNVNMRCDGERKYHDGQELIWDISQGATLGQLHRAVANLCNLSEQNLLMAKHIKEKYKWLILTEQDAAVAQKMQKTKGKGKKKGPNKPDLRNPPFNLQDGDVIGIRTLHEGIVLSEDDFGTADDDEGQERLKQEAEDIRKQREEKRQKYSYCEELAGTSQKKGRSELAIKIHVDNFS